ncbi:unnamed protein product, partial [Choristocarpus tenellus]
METLLLVGKILLECVGEDGERGVDIHWLRPTSDHTHDNVALMTLEKYGKSSFIEGYSLAGDRSGRTGKQKRVKDVRWEPMAGTVLTCKKLVGNGKKIPTKLLTVLRSAIEARERGGFVREGR